MASQNVDPASTTVRSKTKTKTNTQSKGCHSANDRLRLELTKLMTSAPTPGISAFPEGDNLFHWIGTLIGPENTVYAGLKYKLTFDFHQGYPCTPPTVKFSTPIFHPNVDQHGNICLDILKEEWSALFDVRTVLLSLQSLLGEPNNDSPLNIQAAELWDNQVAYKKVLLAKYEKDVTQKEGK